MRKYFIAGNWKMYKTVSESVDVARSLVEQMKGCGERLMIAPAFTALEAVQAV